MIVPKQRLSASVDADLIDAAEEAVARGRTGSVSAWVNEALRIKLTQERRLEALAEFVADYEREHGEISAVELERAARTARSRSVVVRGPSSKSAAQRARIRRPR